MFNITISAVPSVCTALHFSYIDKFLTFQTTNQKLQWLKTTLPHVISRQTSQPNGFALFMTISTGSQQKKASLEALGFKEVFVAPKTHNQSREKQSGALHLWAVQPWVLEERRQALVKELEAEKKAKILPPTQEEIAARGRARHPMMLIDELGHLLQPIIGHRVRGFEFVPEFGASKNNIYMQIHGRYGYNPAEDTGLSGRPTYLEIKERQHMWLEGTI